MTRIAAIQMTSNHEVSTNLKTVEHWLHIAAEKGAKAALLPENFAFMGKEETDKLTIAESFGKGPIQDFLGQISKRYNLWLVAGSLPLISETEGRVFSSTLVFNPEGQCVTRYDKIHLFDVEIDQQESHMESRSVMPGQKVVAIDTPFATLGLTICYDLRFPELFRKLFNAGAEVFMVPSAFTQKTGLVHWEILLRSRAIENLSYVVAANQSGTHSNGRETFGHSMIIDPWGKILDILPSGEGLVMADIELTYLKDIRRKFPVFEHQRIDKLL